MLVTITIIIELPERPSGRNVKLLYPKAGTSSADFTQRLFQTTEELKQRVHTSGHQIMAQLVMEAEVSSRLPVPQTLQLSAARQALDRLYSEVWNVKVCRLNTLLHFSVALVLQYPGEAGLGGEAYAFNMLLSQGALRFLERERDLQYFIQRHLPEAAHAMYASRAADLQQGWYNDEVEFQRVRLLGSSGPRKPAAQATENKAIDAKVLKLSPQCVEKSKICI